MQERPVIDNNTIKIRDYRHAEKPKDIKPEDITQDDIDLYKKEHNLDPNTSDDIIKQVLIIQRGGPVYGQKDWNQPLDPNDETFLTYEGIRQAHDLGNEIFEEVNLSPRGRLCLFVASPSGRTLETTELVVDRIEQLINREKPEHLKAVRIKGLDVLSGLALDNQDSFFVFDQQGAADMGPFSNQMLEKVNKTFGDGTAGEMLWYAKPEELPAIKEELKMAFPNVSPEFIDQLAPKDYKITPEEIVARMIAYYEKLIDLAKTQFPDRPLDIFGVSHNMILDATAIRLLGIEISAAAVKKLGGEARKSLETGQITIEGNNVTVKFRDFENKLSLDELRALKIKLQEEASERKKQWSI